MSGTSIIAQIFVPLIVNPYVLSTTVAWADPEGGQRVRTCVGNTELNTKAAMPNVVFSDLVA